MDLDRFLNLLATLFGATGSLYLLKSVAALSPNLIERLSRSYYGFSAAQVDALTAQKADSIVGIVLVILALAVSIVAAIVPAGIKVFDRLGPAVASAALLTAAAYLALFFIGNGIQRQQRAAVNRIIAADAVASLLESKRLPKSEVSSLRVYARLLENISAAESEPPRVLFERIAHELGLQIPADFDFSDVEPTPPSTPQR